MIGRRIGSLTVVRQLGEGGMGAVYLAEHESLRSKQGAKQYAVKILHQHWTSDPSIVERFHGEAIAAASINHEHIIEIHDRGMLSDGSQYIVMDYVDGKTLGDYCKANGPLSPHDLVSLLGPTGSALKAAHAINIIHRDLKPENILIVPGKRNRLHPVVLDWGIAKLTHDGRAGTRTGQVAGTPQYMAPEQLVDFRSVDQRADIYSLGVIAYQVLTGGWLPHQRSQSDDYAHVSMPAMLLKLTQEDPIDPRERVASLPPRVANVILTAIHREPARRPQSVAQFVLMLAQAVEADGISKSGIEILHEVAPDMLEIGNMLETVRAPNLASVTSPRFPYQLGDKLGAGGMAEVFRATYLGAEGVKRSVAIKRVLDGFSSVPQFATMFVDEARLAAQLSHPNIVSVVGFDRDPTGRLFLAMELVEGRDLAHLAETGPLPFGSIIFVITEILRGLAYAHDLPLPEGPRGLVHRDMSPHNVLLSWEGAVKVSDFGIAKARDATAATASTMIKGKPRYMSPEQANGSALDGRSDLFAVGIMLWELLVGTGENLFGGTTQETLYQVHTRPITRPSSLPNVRKGIPADLEAIAMQLLERDPQRRLANAAAAIEALALCKDSPRNGRGDLERLLAERFPEAVAARTARPHHVHAADVVTKRELPATHKDAAATWQQPQPTTLRGASGEVVAQPQRFKTPLIAAAAITVAVAAMAIIGVVHKRGDRSNNAPAAVSPTSRTSQDTSTPANSPPAPPVATQAPATSPPPATTPDSTAPSNAIKDAPSSPEHIVPSPTTASPPTTATRSPSSPPAPGTSNASRSPDPSRASTAPVTAPPKRSDGSQRATATPVPKKRASTPSVSKPATGSANAPRRFDPDAVGGE